MKRKKKVQPAPLQKQASWNPSPWETFIRFLDRVFRVEFTIGAQYTMVGVTILGAWLSVTPLDFGRTWAGKIMMNGRWAGVSGRWLIFYAGWMNPLSAYWGVDDEG